MVQLTCVFVNPAHNGSLSKCESSNAQTSLFDLWNENPQRLQIDDRILGNVWGENNLIVCIKMK